MIERIRRRAAAGPGSRELRLGIGDDCAILRPRAGEEIVVTTDFSLEGRHFRRDWHTPEAIGHRALARGLSDLAAMGARPVSAFLSLALPRNLGAENTWLDAFLEGFFRLATSARVPLAGGDTSEAPGEHVLIDIALLGGVPAGAALRRSGARAGDRIFCTGALGGAAAELRTVAGSGVRKSEKAASERVASEPAASKRAASGAFLSEPSSTPESSSRRPKKTGLLADGMPPGHPHLFPEPRLAAGQALLRRGLATAAIDLSDGLSTDLQHLCAASKVAAVIEEGRLPFHPLTHGLEPREALNLAVNGGEDYELLFTVSPEARVPKRMGGVMLTEIGVMERQRPGQPLVRLADLQGHLTELPAGGWEHLR